LIKIKSLLLIFLFMTGLLLLSANIEASAGVGIMPAQININEDLTPGDHYILPLLQIHNTGDTGANYAVVLSKVSDPNKYSPDEKFFIINPQYFRLEPGESQSIHLTLTIPIKALPGDYLAHIKAYPVSDAQSGTQIGLAVASKIYFSVKPASTWQAMTNAAAGFFSRYSAFFIGAAALIILAWIIYYLSKHLKIELKLTRKK
jgi:P pilus assembly chaperone PapD